MHGTPFVLCRIGAVEIGSGSKDVFSLADAGKLRQPRTGNRNNEKVHPVLYTIAVVLLLLWVFGLVSSYTLGGFIHIFLVVAIVMVLVNLISGRRSL